MPSSPSSPKSVPSSPPPKTHDQPADQPDEPLIDLDTFSQILDLDEDDTHDFSKGMAFAFFSQAETTFEDMDLALTAKNLSKLSSLGHFLKGSSAALGLSRVQLSCERIQHYGQLMDEERNRGLTETEALNLITPLLSQVKRDYADAKTWLENYYKAADGDGAKDD